MKLSYSRQSIDESDIQAVTDVMRSDFLTQGPKVQEFEDRVKEYYGVKHAITCSSGTAALHAIYQSLGVSSWGTPNTTSEVIIPSITFVATANAVRMCGGKVIFADVDEDTLLVDIDSVQEKVTDRTTAIVGVDYAGQPCDYGRLALTYPEPREQKYCYNIPLVVDACHSMGSYYRDRSVFDYADAVAFSFHAVKCITAGEGGMALNGRFNQGLAFLDGFENHGRVNGECQSLGYNYRMDEMSAALGLSQFKRMHEFVEKRQQIAARYDEAFKDMDRIRPLTKLPDRKHAYHLYVIKTDNRDELKELLAKDGIETQIHYKPVNLQPYYNQKGVAPVAERVWKEILSIPIFPDMTDNEQEYVIDKIRKYRG